MEQSAGFKQLTAKICAFEQQLSLCDTNLEREWLQTGAAIEQEIEAHFASCMNALASRKAILLGELAKVITSQQKRVEDTHAKLLASIEACQLLLKAGSFTYAVSPSGAEAVWQTQTNIPTIRIPSNRITANLPIALLDSIQRHGEVKATSAGIVETYVGEIEGNADGTGQQAMFKSPCGMCFNPHDQCLYITDFNNHAIRKVTPQGNVSTFATNVRFPAGIVMDYKENIFYVTSTGTCKVLKISSNGTITDFVGSGKQGRLDGMGIFAEINTPRDIAIDQQTGILYLCDTNNHLIRQITPQGMITTLTGSVQGDADGIKNAAKFNYPRGIWFVNKVLLVADCQNNKLRKIQISNGEVSTLCNVPLPVFVTSTANGTILISSDSHKLFTFTWKQGNKLDVLAGNGQTGSVDGKPVESSFNSPRGIVVDEKAQACFVADCNNYRIRRVPLPK